MVRSSIANVPIKKVTASDIIDTNDVLAAEEPMEIRLDYRSSGKRIVKSISVTMRTPGHDFDLATGFLYTEGIITSAADIVSVKHASEQNDNVVQVTLNDTVQPDISRLERNFYTTSSCGVCGKASIEAVFAACNILDIKDELRFIAATIYTLPDILRAHQDVFQHTGGLHACALFDTAGSLVLTREDVGRHNALDKLIGEALHKNMLPLNSHLLLLSGRASFELLQKAAMAGIKMVAAVGAPSSLAVQMAEEWGITLIGFLRGERFNIYSAPERVVM
ncbi:MAG: Sulfur carrier protein FdhD [Flavipsychrobacter sp.]|nr:Sulfur carrier protein FdhD [Flavipsychrobacter sp.]